MRRRNLMTVLAGAAANPLLAGAQQKAMPVIGYLASATPESNVRLLPAFLSGLSETGWVEGQNVAIEYRWAEDHYERLYALAAELVSRRVDVIVSTGGITGALAAREASSEIPIVFITGDDPIERGLVTSLARPGNNLTGVSFLTNKLAPKRLELILDLAPPCQGDMSTPEPQERQCRPCDTRNAGCGAQSECSFTSSRPAPRVRSTPPSRR